MSTPGGKNCVELVVVDSLERNQTVVESAAKVLGSRPDHFCVVEEYRHPTLNLVPSRPQELEQEFVFFARDVGNQLW